MMIIVGILRQTGVFEYIAIWAAKRAKGSPFRVMVLLVLITAVASAMLDNVTTVLLIAPVTRHLRADTGAVLRVRAALHMLPKPSWTSLDSGRCVSGKWPFVADWAGIDNFLPPDFAAGHCMLWSL